MKPEHRAVFDRGFAKAIDHINSFGYHYSTLGRALDLIQAEAYRAGIVDQYDFQGNLKIENYEIRIIIRGPEKDSVVMVTRPSLFAIWEEKDGEISPVTIR